MKSLYIARCNDLFNLNTPDVKKWSSVYKMIPTNVSLVDRCSYVKMPYRFKLYEPFNMPRDLSNFNLTYEQCCDKRAAELIALSRSINKPITVFYSGGIDSTAVLIAFMKALDPQELKSRIKVALTLDSINENVNFYYDYIRPRCTMISSEYMSSMIDGSSIVVGGEHNDQLFGSDIIGNIYRFGNYDQIHKPYTREFIVGWMKRTMTEAEANVWFDVLDNQIRKTAPCEVRTNFHFFWWYNFCFKWQCVFFRMFTRMDTDQRSKLNDEFINTYYHHFYSSVDFQKWSMLNHRLKLGDDWGGYKLESKKYIYDYNKDEKYRDEKIKSGSLYRLFLQKKTAVALTDSYEFIDNAINPIDFYQVDNSFI